MLPDYYGLLGIAPDASPEEIARARRKAAKQWHPDAHPEDRERATRRMQEINGAYAVLSNPARRAAYDDELAWETEEREAESRAVAERKAAEREVKEREAAERDMEEGIARRLRWEWQLAVLNVRLDQLSPPAEGRDADALRRALVEVFGPHLERALQGAGGPLCDLYDECAAEVLEAERAAWRAADDHGPATGAAGVVPNRSFEQMPAAGGEGAAAWDASVVAPPIATWARPRRRGRRAVAFAAGAIALAVAGRAAVGYTERGAASESARENLATARSFAGAPTVGEPNDAGERELLMSELRRLDAAMERARRREGRWPSRPPTGLTSQLGVRLQVGRIAGGWVGVATSRASGQACRVDVTTQPSGRARHMLRCGPSASALTPAAVR